MHISKRLLCGLGLAALIMESVVIRPLTSESGTSTSDAARSGTLLSDTVVAIVVARSLLAPEISRTVSVGSVKTIT